MKEDRPEIKAWTNLISLKNIPENNKEIERLTEFNSSDLDKEKKKRDQKAAKKAELMRKVAAQKTANSRDNTTVQSHMLELEPLEQKFMEMCELTELSDELYGEATQNLETTAFDAFSFETVLNENAL